MKTLFAVLVLVLSVAGCKEELPPVQVPGTPCEKAGERGMTAKNHEELLCTNPDGTGNRWYFTNTGKLDK